MTTPTFPTYTGTGIPPTLRPWNPWHYWLLLKWVYFQPSKLRHYLRHALPDLYQERGGKALLRASLRPAIFNLYLMTPVLTYGLGAMLMLITSAIQGTEPDWGGLAVGVAFGLGGVRLPFYLLELLLYYANRWWPHDPFDCLRRHPAWWDELAVLPLPGLVPLIQRCLEQDAERTLPMLTHLAANPFQRWAVQKALARWLGQQASPLLYLYHLAHDADLDAYFSPPAEPANFRTWPTARELVLAEIGQVNVRNRYGNTMDHWVWRLTYRLRDTFPSSLAEFALFLYWCFRRTDWLVQAPIEKIVEILQQDKTQAQIQAIAYLPQGQEVVVSFQLITIGLIVAEVTGMATLFSPHPDWGSLDEPLLRPTVIETLKALADVSQDVANGLNATSRGTKAGALIRANGALQELAEYVAKQVLPPEQVLLARLVGHWQEIIAKEQGKLGAEALQAMSPQMRREAGIGERQSAVWQRPVKPFDNPYIAGDPVYPPLLVGRTDIFNRIGEIWGAKENPDSIILYGHRRMGKSSILRNLAQAAPEKTVIAYADMQGKTSFVASTADLLLELADQITHALNAIYPDQPTSYL